MVFIFEYIYEIEQTFGLKIGENIFMIRCHSILTKCICLVYQLRLSVIYESNNFTNHFIKPFSWLWGKLIMKYLAVNVQKSWLFGKSRSEMLKWEIRPSLSGIGQTISLGFYYIYWLANSKWVQYAIWWGPFVTNDDSNKSSREGGLRKETGRGKKKQNWFVLTSHRTW